MFDVHQVSIKLKSINERIRFIPFGDIHRDSPAHATREWTRFLKEAASRKNAFFLGMGDYMDGYSTSERAVMNCDGLHDSSRERHEEDGRGRIRVLAKELAFMKGRVIGMLNGNHYQTYRDGTNGDQYLSNLLHAKYLGVCGAIRLCLDYHGARIAMTIVAHHGRGAGQTAGGKLNSVEKLASYWPDAEIALMGDNHARGALPLGDKLMLCGGRNGLTIKSRKSWIARTGSFLKSYEPGRSSYVVDACLAPASLGWVEFDIGVERCDNVLNLDIKAIQ